MFGECGLEEIDECGIHEAVVIWDAEDDERRVDEFVGEFPANARGVFFLHAEDDVGPTDVTGGEFDARVVFRAGGTGLVARMILEESLGSGAAPLIAGAEEEELGFQSMGSAE